LSLALARKYRPKSFDDLIGQEAISQTLSLALDSNRLSHAYLFSGLRGSGKTSTARIFAKALICEKGSTSKPCEVCSSCVMANESRHMDIIEMDGASNRKIDDIRELIEHTKYKPATARYKIFIIDEVHMLTKEAFNALLKTLEEPPSFVKFILATTDPLKLPATILSRTQHFRFRKISQSILEKHLIRILNIEGVEYKKEAISIIARVGAGSVRDALTLLDQAIVYSKSSIDTRIVTNMLGIIEPSLLENLIDAILVKDRKSILEFISNSSDFEAEMVIDELMLYLKDILLQGSEKISPMIIDRFFRVLASSKSLLTIGSSGEFVLALTMFKMMNSLDGEIIEENINRVLVKKEKIKEEPKVIEEDVGLAHFKTLIDKLYDRNYELGECFEKNIRYISFSNTLLIWESIASGDDRTLLRYSWGMIRMFVQESFGFDTKIKNIPKKELPSKIETPPPPKEQEIEPVSKIENKRDNRGEILKEPMISRALELFSPKKVMVKRKKGV
jgi:DNA polymerase-3 subunit gamma/tau